MSSTANMVVGGWLLIVNAAGLANFTLAVSGRSKRKNPPERRVTRCAIDHVHCVHLWDVAGLRP
jgi:hypothetical protein